MTLVGSSIQPLPEGENMSKQAEQAEQVVVALYAIKWVIVGVTALCTIVAAAGVALQDNSASYAVSVAVGIVLVGMMWALFVWVLFGWFEHTLRALVAIAVNTSAVHQRV